MNTWKQNLKMYIKAYLQNIFIRFFNNLINLGESYFKSKQATITQSEKKISEQLVALVQKRTNRTEEFESLQNRERHL